MGGLGVYLEEISCIDSLAILENNRVMCNRLLEYICNKDGSPSRLCNFNVMQNRTNPRARKTAHMDKLLSPFPLTLGHLKVCRSADFRKAHRNVNPSSLKCRQQDLKKKFVIPAVEGEVVQRTLED